MNISLNGGRKTPQRSISGTFHEVCSYWKLVICLDMHHFYIVYSTVYIPTIMPPKRRTTIATEAKLLRGSLDKNLLGQDLACSYKYGHGLHQKQTWYLKKKVNRVQSQFEWKFAKQISWSNSIFLVHNACLGRSCHFKACESSGRSTAGFNFVALDRAALPSRNSRGAGEYLAPKGRHLLPATSGAETFDEPDLVPFKRFTTIVLFCFAAQQWRNRNNKQQTT